MSAVVVHHCDWCNDEVPYSHTPLNGTEPIFAARITVEDPLNLPAKVYDVCARCSLAQKALTQGRYRR